MRRLMVKFWQLENYQTIALSNDQIPLFSKTPSETLRNGRTTAHAQCRTSSAARASVCCPPYATIGPDLDAFGPLRPLARKLDAPTRNF